MAETLTEPVTPVRQIQWTADTMTSLMGITFNALPCNMKAGKRRWKGKCI